MTATTGDDADVDVLVKVVLRSQGRWVLLQNTRGEWGLPGGRIEVGDETLEDVARRGCRDELGVDIKIGRLVDSHLFEVAPGRRVVVLCFVGELAAAEVLRMTLGEENDAVAIFATGELRFLSLPAGCRKAIAGAERRPRNPTGG